MSAGSLYENMCRLCLKKRRKLLSIFNKDGFVNLSDAIMACTAIKIIKNDGLPDEICTKCSVQLKAAFKFKHQCESSDNWLRNSIDSDALIQINMKNENLTSEAGIQNVIDFVNVDMGYSDAENSDIYEPDLGTVNITAVDSENIDALKKEVENSLNNATSNCQIDEYTNSESVIDSGILSEGKYGCNMCTESYTSERQLRIHKMTHPCKYKCSVCKEKFLSSAGYQSHLISHQNDSRSTECDVCHKTYRTYRHLMKHKVIHTGKTKISCTVCGKMFANNGNLRRHLLIHEGQRPFVCHHCGISFNQSSSLNLHISAKHTTARPHLCNNCGRRFKEKRALEKHITARHSTNSLKPINDVHKLPQEKPYACPICGKILCTKYGYIYHMNSHSDNPSKPFLCTWEKCDKAFKNKNQLTCHERVHTGEKPYKCKVCNKCFSQNSHLHDHFSTHTGYKKHKCGVCNHAFIQKGNLRHHMMTHTGKTPFVCELCGKGFYVSNKLKQHIAKVH